LDSLLKSLLISISHIQALLKTFANSEYYSDDIEFEIYNTNLENFEKTISSDELTMPNELYALKGRQMILADLIEYILISRGSYSMASKKKEDKETYIRAIFYFVNMLMGFENITVDVGLRNKVLEELSSQISDISGEELYEELRKFRGKVGNKKGSEAPKKLDQYFDTLLPKTAGGLWHELLVNIFLIRGDYGYVIPLLLTQKLYGRDSHLVPPDFLLITKDKNIYGIEVGTKKEIQSGSFSLSTNIPTATIDTENSRTSDRCPICQKWIPFCDYTINTYSDFDKDIERAEVKCLKECNIFEEEDILNGKCNYTKYSRGETKKFTHQFTDNLHYHYRCVLNSLEEEERNKLIEAKDITAIKTHYPDYSGLEALKT